MQRCGSMNIVSSIRYPLCTSLAELLCVAAENRQLSRMNLLDARRTRLVLRNFRSRIERWIRQLIDRQLFSPMIRNEDRVWPNRPAPPAPETFLLRVAK